MRAFTTLIALAVAAVSAQNASYTSSLNITIDPSLVDAQQRATWCQGQTNTCGLLCADRTNKNSCNIEDLSFQCKCASNDTEPGLQFYTQTLPTYKCEFAFSECNRQNTGNADGQRGCRDNIQKLCGTVAPPTVPVSSADGNDGDSSSSATGAVPSTVSKGRTGGSVTSTTSGGLAAPTMAPASQCVAAAAAVGILVCLV